MSGDFQLEYPVLQLRWTPEQRKPPGFWVWDEHISEFTFQGVRWSLMVHSIYCDFMRDEANPISAMMMDDWLDRDWVERIHHICLCKLSGGPHAPFDVSVHVEVGDGTERIVVDGLSCKRRIGSDETYEIIWKQSDFDVRRMLPDFRSNGVLRFLVELKKDDVLKAKDTATQTKCSIPEGFQLHCVDNLSEDFAQMMVQGSDTDVEFRCEGQSFRAHGPVICARSPVIAAMLSSDMVEGRTRVIKIHDVPPEVFQIFLKYIYTGKTPELTFELAWTLYESADQYAVLGLARRCSRYLVENLSEENVWDVLVLADAHHDWGFVEEVVDYMVDRNTPITSDRLTSFAKEHPILAQRLSLLNCN